MLTVKPLFITIMQLLGHLFIAGVFASLFESPLSVMTAYFAVMTFRYSLAINIFSFRYASNPDEVEKILRKAFEKSGGKGNDGASNAN